MGANDLPPERPKASELRRMNSPSQDQFDKVLQKLANNATAKTDCVALENEGQISRMPIPSGWTRSVSEQKLSSTSNYVEFHPVKNPQTKLCTFYRGHRISQDAATKFQQLLKADLHELEPAEFLALGELLRDKANADEFELKSKRSIDIGGKHVLLIEGKYKEIKERTYAIFVDADKTGEVVQEIFYQAPESQYAKYQKVAEEAIKSISWK